MQPSLFQSQFLGVIDDPDEGLESKYDPTKDPRLRFIGRRGGSTIGLSQIGTSQTVEFSTDYENWSPFTTNVELFVEESEVLFIRGKLTEDNNDADNTKFYITGKMACKGEINYLWNYENLNAPLKEYCGCCLFKDCSGLIEAPKLPATSLTESCYRSMFENCTNLITAPELPATTELVTVLADNAGLLEKTLKGCADPVVQWDKTRKLLLHANVDTIDVAKYESQYVKAVKEENFDSLKKLYEKNKKQGANIMLELTTSLLAKIIKK